MDFARQRVEGGARFLIGHHQYFVVDVIAAAQRIGRARDAALVGRVRHVLEGRDEIERQEDIVGVVAECRRQEGEVRRDVVEGADDIVGGEDRVERAWRIVARSGEDAHRAAIDRCFVVDLQQIAVAVRIDLDIEESAGGEGDIVGLKRADGIARRDRAADHHIDRAGDGAAAAECAVDGNRDVGQDAVDQQCALLDRGAAGQRVDARQDQYAGAGLGQRTADARNDARNLGRLVVAADDKFLAEPEREIAGAGDRADFETGRDDILRGKEAARLDDELRRAARRHIVEIDRCAICRGDDGVARRSRVAEEEIAFILDFGAAGGGTLRELGHAVVDDDGGAAAGRTGEGQNLVVFDARFVRRTVVCESEPTIVDEAGAARRR